MPRQMIWDLPVRLFHLLFALGMSAAAAIALLGGEHGPAFRYHMLIGLTLAVMVLLRVLWGFVGSRHARFASFLVTPAGLVRYLAAAMRGQPQRHVGPNPGSAYAMVTMFLLTLGLAATGIMMGRGNEAVEEIHELLAYAMVGVIALHLAGVALHTVQHRENIVRSMVDGRKEAPDAEAIPSARPVAALVGLVLVGVVGVSVIRHYDSVAGTTRLSPIGPTIALGEIEADEGGGGGDDDD